jgi:hypothetical protein
MLAAVVPGALMAPKKRYHPAGNCAATDDTANPLGVVKHGEGRHAKRGQAKDKRGDLA